MDFLCAAEETEITVFWGLFLSSIPRDANVEMDACISADLSLLHWRFGALPDRVATKVVKFLGGVGAPAPELEKFEKIANSDHDKMCGTWIDVSSQGMEG